MFLKGHGTGLCYPEGVLQIVLSPSNTSTPKQKITIYHNGEEESTCYFRDSNPGLQISYFTDWPGPYEILKRKCILCHTA
jgi:hypothetical protein